jgi:hypothetical protein
MSVSDDKLRIPIEVKTEDIKEIEKLIQEITEAESDIQGLKPRRGKGTGDITSRSAFSFPSGLDERGGIFQTMREEGTTPQAFRDKTSKQPFQRGNQFSELKTQVNDMQENISQNSEAVEGLQNILNNVSSGITTASIVGLGGNAGSLLGKISGIATKALIPLAVISTVVEVAFTLIEQAIAPGGPLDRRFKRILSDEVANTIDLKQKQEINQGFKVVRVSAQPLIRGEAGTTSSLSQRQVIYDLGLARSMSGL